MSPFSRFDIDFPSTFGKGLGAVRTGVAADPFELPGFCFGRFLRKTALGVVDACWSDGGVEDAGEEVVKLVEYNLGGSSKEGLVVGLTSSITSGMLLAELKAVFFELGRVV